MTQAPAPHQGSKLEERTKLLAPHNGGELTFLHPAYGPSNYANVGLSIVQDNLKKPTMAETASLVDAAFNPDNRYSTETMDIIRGRQLWAFTGTLYVPKGGAFIQDDPEIRDGMPFMDKDSLEQKLNAKDPSVRHVPFGYKIKEMIPLELAKNPYVIALAGEEGAEKLAKVAEKFKDKPYLWSFESVDNTLTRVSALHSEILGHGLLVVGLGNGEGGYAFGILK